MSASGCTADRRRSPQRGTSALTSIVGARICAAAHGAQVLLSATTTAELEEFGLQPHDLGEHHLKDLPDPERLYQLFVDGLPRDFPPLRTQRPVPAAAGLPDYSIPPADVPCPIGACVISAAGRRAVLRPRAARRRAARAPGVGFCAGRRGGIRQRQVVARPCGVAPEIADGRSIGIGDHARRTSVADACARPGRRAARGSACSSSTSSRRCSRSAPMKRSAASSSLLF